VQVVGILRQVRAGRLIGKPLDEMGFQADRGSRRREVVRRAVLEVDPEKLSFADAVVKAGRQLDLPVLSGGVVEADPRPAVALLGDRDQWTTASRIATSPAMAATAYWSTSIERSTCSPVGLSITPTWGITV
jgi:hypothetical protein